MTTTITKPAVLKALQRLQPKGDSFSPLQVCLAMGLKRSKDRIHQITVHLYDLAGGGRVRIHSETFARGKHTIRFSTHVEPPLWIQLWALSWGLAAAMITVPVRRVRTRAKGRRSTDR